MPQWFAGGGHARGADRQEAPDREIGGMRLKRGAAEAMPQWFAGGGHARRRGILLQDAGLADWVSLVRRKHSPTAARAPRPAPQHRERFGVGMHSTRKVLTAAKRHLWLSLRLPQACNGHDGVAGVKNGSPAVGMLAVRIVKKPPIVRSGECGWSEGRLKQCRNGSPAVGMLAAGGFCYRMPGWPTGYRS
jgi:hypothetical protein